MYCSLKEGSTVDKEERLGRKSYSTRRQASRNDNGQLEQVIMDEVYGRGASSSCSQPNPHGHNNCDECAESGNMVTASGFCENCSDFLCTSCIEQHKKARSLRHHKIFEGKDMPTIKPRQFDVEKCTMHPGRPIEAYCPDDDTFGCLLCFTVGHRSCRNVALLSDLSRGVETSKEFLEVQNAADRYKKLEEECMQLITKCRTMNDEWHRQTLERFQKFRSDVLSNLEKIGIKVHKKADILKEENETELNKLAHKIAQNTEHVKNCMVNIEDKKASKKNEELFIALKKNGRVIMGNFDRLKTLCQDIAIKKFDFHLDTTIRKRLINNKINVQKIGLPFQQLTDSEEKKSNIAISPGTTCKSSSRLNIKSQNDGLVTCIMELSETKLILANYFKKCLMLFDITREVITKRHSVTSHPFGISKVTGCRVAVSFPNAKQIHFFKADQTLEPCGSIDVPSGCYGLHCTGDMLIASNINPARVQILDLAGTVHHTIRYDSSGTELFKYPRFLTVGNDNKLIYVSDEDKHTLTCMTATGVIQWIYRDKKLKDPRGVTTGADGCSYICCFKTRTIHVVSREGTRLAIIWTDQTRDQNPYALCYRSNTHTLYVSQFTDDYILRLRLQ